ncbi:MAG: hypothetical protein M0R22_00510 [Dehalococcoidia bacterium]|jgi:hypothetical protein|nr:hypothetical protein [Dehalococcoidia bacterium]
MTEQERINFITNGEALILDWQNATVPASCVALRDAVIAQTAALVESARRNPAAGLTGAEWDANRARQEALARQFDECWDRQGGIPTWLKVGAGVGVVGLIVYLVARK